MTNPDVLRCYVKKEKALRDGLRGPPVPDAGWRMRRRHAAGFFQLASWEGLPTPGSVKAKRAWRGTPPPHQVCVEQAGGVSHAPAHPAARARFTGRSAQIYIGLGVGVAPSSSGPPSACAGTPCVFNELVSCGGSAFSSWASSACAGTPCVFDELVR